MEEVPQGFNPGLPDPRAAWCHGAWLHPEGTGRHVCCLGKAARPASGPLAQACRPLQLGLYRASVARELRPGSPRWLCPSVGPARLFQPAEPQLHKGCLDTAGPAGPLLHRRKTSIDQGPPGSRLSSLPFSVARRPSGGSWRDAKVTPGCLQKDVSEQKPD